MQPLSAVPGRPTHHVVFFFSGNVTLQNRSPGPTDPATATHYTAQATARGHASASLKTDMQHQRLWAASRAAKGRQACLKTQAEARSERTHSHATSSHCGSSSCRHTTHGGCRHANSRAAAPLGPPPMLGPAGVEPPTSGAVSTDHRLPAHQCQTDRRSPGAALGLPTAQQKTMCCGEASERNTMRNEAMFSGASELAEEAEGCGAPHLPGRLRSVRCTTRLEWVGPAKAQPAPP